MVGMSWVMATMALLGLSIPTILLEPVCTEQETGLKHVANSVTQAA